jgi:dihydroorotate dehydrogenase electron transfer subunit
MSAYIPGKPLDILVGLGNGFDISHGARPLLIGGGTGTPPLYALCKALLARGAKPTVALGFSRKTEALLLNEFKALGIRVLLATMDGSSETHGFVTDAIQESNIDYDYIYACGPELMLRAVYELGETDGQYCFEERMACGFGACMGCTHKTKHGYKRVCADGPVFFKEEIKWRT